MIEERETDYATGLMVFLAGAAAGALVALLYAPASGPETRGQIGGWLHARREHRKSVVERLRERMPGRA